MQNITDRIWYNVIHGEYVRLPRKVKKSVLGTWMSKNKLNKLIQSVTLELVKSSRPSYPDVYIRPYSFCPECGCKEEKCTYRSYDYPEVYETYHCIRCGALTAYADNCPYTHRLEEIHNDQYEAKLSILNS